MTIVTYNIIHYEYMKNSNGKLVELMKGLHTYDALYVTGINMSSVRSVAWTNNLDLRVVKYLEGALVVPRKN